MKSNLLEMKKRMRLSATLCNYLLRNGGQPNSRYLVIFFLIYIGTANPILSIPTSTGHHLKTVQARRLHVVSFSSSFQVDSISHIFFKIWLTGSLTDTVARCVVGYRIYKLFFNILTSTGRHPQINSCRKSQMVSFFSSFRADLVHINFLKIDPVGGAQPQN